MPIGQDYTCAKCGESKNGAVDQYTSVYFYRGKSKDRKKANDVVCTACTSKIMEGWKFPVNLG